MMCESEFDEEFIHVVPCGDTYPHVLKGLKCWCKPLEDDGIIIHNSHDGREAYEQGLRKPH